MKVTYSAPAKVILSGEHSVVYTKPAFVTAVDFHLQTTIEDGSPRDENKDVSHAVEYTTKIVTDFLKKGSYSVDIRPFRYTFSSNIPSGRGMGSSAAFCVALTASLLHFYTGKKWDKQAISSLAYHCEKHFHGMPSGVDVSASCYGGLIFYRKEFEFLKTISSLNFKIPKAFEEKLILIDTGKPSETTKEMVVAVGKRYNQQPKQMESILTAIERVTKRMVVSIVKEDLSMFTESIQTNQTLLEELGIVSQSTTALLKELAPYGVGKVTGAGGYKKGSGFVLFIARSKDLFAYLENSKISWLPFKQDLQGVNYIE